MPASAANTVSAATKTSLRASSLNGFFRLPAPISAMSSGNSWCSSVCCMYATKEAIVGKEHANNLEPTIFFMDIRAHGKDFDRFVNRAKEEYGIRYIRSIPSSVKELQQTKDLLITYVMEDGRLVEEEFDMVVLSVGLTPPAEARELAESLGMDLD